jgi:hypothetical protein
MKYLGLVFALFCSMPAWGSIAYVPGSQTICSQTTGSSGTACTLAAPTTAGNLVVAGLTWKTTSSSIDSVLGNVTSSYFFPYAQVCNGSGSCSAILICRDCAALTSVTPKFTGGTNYNLSIEEYSGVTALGVTQAVTGSSTSPGVTDATGDANDWLVAVTSSVGNAPTAGTGNLRSAAGSGSLAGAACDNTSATAGTLSCTATIASGAWSAVGVELRTAIPMTYIWPDCDAVHPCVIHEKNTVAQGTTADTLTGPFKVTVPPTLPGNLMKLTISHPSSNPISSLTDDHSNAWTVGATTTDNTNGETTEVRYVCGAATGTSVLTIAFSNAMVDNDVAQFSYDEVSGIAASACGDGGSGSSGGQGVLNPGPVTTTASGDLILTFGICASYATEDGNQAGVAMPDDVSAKIAENDWDQFMSMVEVQGTAGAIDPTIYANAQDVNNNNRMYWNIVSQGFKAQSGAGTQPTGIQVVTDQHFINWPSLGWNPLPSNGNAVVFSTSNPGDGFGMTNLADNYGTPYTRTPYSDPTVDPQQYSVCYGTNVAARDRIFSYTPDRIQTHVEIYTIAGAKNATGTGCVGTTVNHYAGKQGSATNDNIVGDPVVVPTINAGSNSVIIGTSYVGTGPPSAMCISGGVTPPTCTGQSAGVVFNSIYATGMTDSSSWSTGDSFEFFYTNSTASRSMDFLMANGNAATSYYGAAIEILGNGTTVAATTPVVTVTPSATSITTTQSLSVTVAVAGGSGDPVPTGSVTLSGGGYMSAATTLVSGGATITVPAGSLAVGSDTLTVTYTPDSASAATYTSATGTASVTVTGTALETPAVTVMPSPSTITTAQSLAVTVAVNGGSGNPTPTGTVVLSGGGYTSAATALVSGTVTFTIPAGSLVTGTDGLTATYTPDTGSATTYNSASGAATVTVNASAKTIPAVTVTAAATTITTAQSLAVTVAVNGGSGNPTPTGTVVLSGGGYTSAATALSSGAVTITIPGGALATGTDTLTATYTPDTAGATTYTGGTGSAPVTVTAPAKVTPTVTVTPSAASITTTQALTVTVAVSGGSGNPTPTGTVTLSGGGYTAAAATLSGGAATINIPAGSLATGSDTLTVTYTPDTGGSTTYNSATGSAAVVVTTPAKVTPTVTVTPSATNITTTQSLSVTVAVAGSGGTIPTGTVMLTSGGYSSAASTLSGGAATITILGGSLAVGSDTLTVVYTPDTASSATYNSGAGSAVVTVTAAAKITPTVAVTPAATNITTAQSLSVAVVVAGGSGNPVPTGTVTLTGGGYGSAATALTGGAATIAIPAGMLGTGADTLTVVYTPDTGSTTTYNSASGSAMVTVTTPARITPAVTVTPSATSITTTQPLTVTAVVSGGSGNAIPTGTVTVTGGGYESAATVLAGGTATITIPAGVLGTGNDTLTVTYSPDAASSTIYNGAAGSATIAVTTLATFTPAVAVTPSATSITTTQGLIVTVAVNGGSGNPVPTGEVVLSGGGYTSGGLTLSAGAATITIPGGSLAVGSDTLTVLYMPDAPSSGTYKSATGSAVVTVGAVSNASFALSNSGGITVAAGATTGNTSTITVTPSGGFTGTVALSCSVTTALVSPTAPPTCSVSAPSLSISGASATAVVTVTTTATTTGAMRKFLIPGGGMVLALVCWVGVPRRRRALLVVLLVFVGFGALGCGTSIGGTSSGSGGTAGTTAGTYVVTVNGSAGGVVESTVIFVTVN